MSTPEAYSLSVETDDRIAEIAVYDGNLNVVAKGVNRLTEKLPGGLYRVRIRVGSSTDEKLVALDGDKSVRFGQVSFLSPIPLKDTEKTHEYHMAAAVWTAANFARDPLGAGASIMVFAREWSLEQNRSGGNPAEGLTLLDANETFLADIGGEARVQRDRDACAGWRAHVKPGGYFIRLELGDADKTVLLRPIFVSPGHQLQVFCLVSDHIVEEQADETAAGNAAKARRTIRRADLTNAAIAISRSETFDPDDRRTRLSELGCNALAQSRTVMTDALIDQLMESKFENPMLGLFAAHLLLRDRPDDKNMFRIVTDNLLTLLGPDHPDLRTLWWQRGDSSPIGDGRLHVLPMLRASWNLAVDRSTKSHDIFSLGTFHDKLPRIVPSASWMVLMDNDWAVSDLAIDQYLQARARMKTSRAEVTAALEEFRKQYARRAYTAARELLPTSLSQYLPNLAPDIATVGAGSAEGARRSPGEESVQGAGPPLSKEKADLARNLAIPVDVLDSILRRKGHES